MTDLSMFDTAESDAVPFDPSFYESVSEAIREVEKPLTHPDYPGRRLAVLPVNAIQRSTAVFDVWVDDSRDALLTPFARATLNDRYLSPGERYQDRFANCVRFYANDQAHAQRMYEYISQLWCLPATPILSNGGTTKGNLISCFLNSVNDSMKGITQIWNENAWLGARGGGTGTGWSNVRSIGEAVGVKGKTSGVMSFVKVSDSQVGCISQAGNRRGAGAVYLDMSHPEIDAFLDMRREAGGDPDRKALNLHHGVTVSDEFMRKAFAGETWDLISPHTGEVIETVSAQALLIKLLITRLETGEPYMMFKDAVNRATPEFQRKSGLLVTTSNLCIEIMLPTGRDHHGRDRTAVCCLFQPNLEKFHLWSKDEQFFLDIGYFMDNVLQDFIDYAGEEFVNARYSAMRERSIGIGAMGFHSFLQSRGIAFEGAMAKAWNKIFFKHIRSEMDRVSAILAEERGACPDAAEHGVMERFACKLALAPTASVSIIAGCSAGADAIPANIFIQKTLDGSFEVKNPALQAILVSRGKDDLDTWNSILERKGSVQHLDFLSDAEKLCFKTSFEIDNLYIIDLAADRVPYICQSQSTNLALTPDCDKFELLMLHKRAWEAGLKSLYYLRSDSIQSTDNNVVKPKALENVSDDDRYAVCLACQ